MLQFLRTGGSLTLSFVAGEHHQVVFGCVRAAGQRELQSELVEEAEAGHGRVGREGRVAKLVVAAEARTGDVDGCDTNTQTHTVMYLPPPAWGDRRETRGSDLSPVPPLAKRWHCCYTFPPPAPPRARPSPPPHPTPPLWTLLHDDLFSNTITTSLLFCLH